MDIGEKFVADPAVSIDAQSKREKVGDAQGQAGKSQALLPIGLRTLDAWASHIPPQFKRASSISKVVI
jgi:hypothetical protein